MRPGQDIAMIRLEPWPPTPDQDGAHARGEEPRTMTSAHSPPHRPNTEASS